jgi:hypothetical protein
MAAAAAAAAVAPTPDANGAGPACFPFLFEGDVDRLGQHFVRCIHLGQWELVSGVECCAHPHPRHPRHLPSPVPLASRISRMHACFILFVWCLVVPASTTCVRSRSVVQCCTVPF